MSAESRYSGEPIETMPSHTYDARGKANTENDEVVTVWRAARFRTVTFDDSQSTELPEILASGLDTFHLLAGRHLDDQRNWWILADANPQIRYPLDLKRGDAVRIPS